MPRVHFVKKAMKDNVAVKKGEPYYWWEFRFGGKHYSATPPKQSQLTQSEFLSTVYDLNDRLDSLTADDFSDLGFQLQDIADEFRSQAEECESKKSNMPDSLQESPTGNLLEERACACNDIADSLENIDCEVDESEWEQEVKDELGETATPEEIEEEIESRRIEKMDELISEAQTYQYDGE